MILKVEDAMYQFNLYRAHPDLSLKEAAMIALGTEVERLRAALSGMVYNAPSTPTYQDCRRRGQEILTGAADSAVPTRHTAELRDDHYRGNVCLKCGHDVLDPTAHIEAHAGSGCTCNPRMPYPQIDCPLHGEHAGSALLYFHECPHITGYINNPNGPCALCSSDTRSGESGG